ncbi:hypothetical protein HP572_05545 [Pectobacterium sp. PL64]|uniref:hypothetical protein n=1 Tax=Pectobacterium sp. PL64 TaxID=2738983 RepID=UPI001F0BFC88|nr:hypothetical protein [Pectobacterium sp. PL64]UMO89014.1 hypothetical protein HP572_05545 [Pectobacterium sp. PL64]
MKTKCRYYLIKNDIYEMDLTSSEFIKNHDNPIFKLAILLLEIKINSDGLKITNFHQLSSKYEKQAILMFHDMWEYNEKEHIHLSDELIQKISSHVEKSINSIIRKYHSFASEDMITAVLGEKLYDEFNDEEMDVDIKFQSYSSVKKEPINGADLSFIFDIKDKSGRRIIKSILIQSKKVKNPFTANHNISRLEEQINKMERITNESYVFQYSENGFSTYKSSARNDVKSINILFCEVLRCQSGDKRKSVLAHSLDSRHIMRLSIDEDN